MKNLISELFPITSTHRFLGGAKKEEVESPIDEWKTNREIHKLEKRADKAEAYAVATSSCRTRYKNGIGPIEDKLVATAARLQAEIDHLREQIAGN
jgi:hypothetical protein